MQVGEFFFSYLLFYFLILLFIFEDGRILVHWVRLVCCIFIRCSLLYLFNRRSWTFCCIFIRCILLHFIHCSYLYPLVFFLFLFIYFSIYLFIHISCVVCRSHSHERIIPQVTLIADAQGRLLCIDVDTFVVEHRWLNWYRILGETA